MEVNWIGLAEDFPAIAGGEFAGGNMKEAGLRPPLTFGSDPDQVTWCLRFHTLNLPVGVSSPSMTAFFSSVLAS